jgi:multifunctional beta-oxidation protein
MENFGNLSGGGSDESSGSSYEDPEDTPEIKEAKKNAPAPEDFSYTERDVTLYNLGVGVRECRRLCGESTRDCSWLRQSCGIDEC